MIKLTRTESSKNLHRFYALHITPTLFGEWGLIAEWGRIGSSGRVQERIFDSEQAAEIALAKCMRIKSRRGYIQACWVIS